MGFNISWRFRQRQEVCVVVGASVRSLLTERCFFFISKPPFSFLWNSHRKPSYNSRNVQYSFGILACYLYNSIFSQPKQINSLSVLCINIVFTRAIEPFQISQQQIALEVRISNGFGCAAPRYNRKRGSGWNKLQPNTDIHWDFMPLPLRTRQSHQPQGWDSNICPPFLLPLPANVSKKPSPLSLCPLSGASGCSIGLIIDGWTIRKHCLCTLNVQWSLRTEPCLLEIPLF